MKFKEIFSAIIPFASVAASFIPGGPAVVGLLNAVLPDDKKIPASATGQQILDAHESLTPEQKSSLAEKKIDLEMLEIKESNTTVRTMLESDAKNPHSTRPYIAKHSFHTVAFIVVVTVLMWGYGITTGKPLIVKAVADGWQFVLALIGPLVILLHAYFGILKKEHKDRLNAAGDKPTTGLSDIIKNMLNRSK